VDELASLLTFVLPLPLVCRCPQEYVIGKIEKVLQAAGSDLSKLVKVNSESGERLQRAAVSSLTYVAPMYL